MITMKALPKAYIPYQSLNICSNMVLGGGNLVVVGDVVPLLIGSGDTPKIWLQAPIDQEGKNYIPLVVESVSTHPTVTVTSDGNSLSIFAGGTQVLHIFQQTKDNATVNKLDLRPIGFNLFGNSKSLFVGNSEFSASSFSGVGAMFSFGGRS